MITINNKKDCCGCSACYSICPKSCISMNADKEGFKYPKINNDNCINCGLCEKVCPIKNRKEEIPFEQRGYVVQHKDKKILKESTSGGAFTAIAQHIIEQGGVVFGAAFDENFNVVHTYVENTEELAKFRNSKYVQSDIKDTFKEVKDFLQSGRFVCYSGTPCQIEGLKSFLQKEYDNLITVDMVCHAIPSPLIWEKFKNAKSNGAKILSAEFRSKEPFGYEYSQMKLTTDRIKYRSGVESDPYLRAFFSDLSDRPSCYECAFKKRYRVSDITIWDCFKPNLFDKSLNNNLGVTRVLAHSERGKLVFEKSCNKLNYKDIDSNTLVSGVNEMFNSVNKNKKRNDFFKDAVVMNDVDFFEKYFPQTIRTHFEKLARITFHKLGVYSTIKNLISK